MARFGIGGTARTVAAVIALQLSGCAGDQGTRSIYSSTDTPEETQALLVSGTVVLAAATVTAIALAIVTTSGDDYNAPAASRADVARRAGQVAPEEPPTTTFGWSVERRGDEVTWLHCTSRIFCTEQRVTVAATDLLESEKVGRVVPTSGTLIAEVDVYALRVRGGVISTPWRR